MEVKDFAHGIPSKENLIVAYCFCLTCPFSGYLAEKLVDLIYTKILEYSVGLKEWRVVQSIFYTRAKKILFALVFMKNGKVKTFI